MPPPPHKGLEVVVLRPDAICAAARSRCGDLLVARLKDHGWPRDCHPGDIIPWVHTDDLAQMTWLAATHPAAGQRFLAVDRNVMLASISSRYGRPRPAGDRSATGAGSQPVPHREDPHRPWYRKQRSFEHTLIQLLTLAGNSPGPSAE